MSFLVLRSSVNEIHPCPEMKMAEASVILTPFSGVIMKLCLMELKEVSQIATCGSSLWLPDEIAMRGFVSPQVVKS